MTFKIIRISILVCIILCLTINQSKSQIIDNEQAPASVVWKQINSKDFRMIFPQEFEPSALLLSHQLDQIIQNASEDLKIKPKKISIIFHENHIEQNGFAQLAPRKVEVFSSPGPASDNTEWLPNLLQHELRHVAQFDKLTGKLHKPFLEQLAFALYGIHLPAWYFEGDAVSIETQFSNGGRGRAPSWFMPIKANLLEGKKYSFNKNILGSFKDITPSYYLTGYLMNSYLSNHFGQGVKERIMEDMRGKLIRPFNFNLALKKQTKLYSKQLHDQALNELDSIWKSEEKPKDYESLFATSNKFPTDYLLPQTNQSGAIFYLESNPQIIPTVKKIQNGKIENLIKIGYQLTPYFHVNNDFLVWDEMRKNGRFGKQTFNVIRILDLHTGRTKTISKKTRFYCPVLTSNSKKVLASALDLNNVSSLVYIDPKTNETEKIIEFEPGLFIQQLALNNEDTKALAIAMTAKGTNLIEIDLIKKSWSPLLPWSNQELQRPIYVGNDVVFKAHFNGTDNLYLLRKNNNSLIRLSDSRIGAAYPSLGTDNQIFYNEYEYTGFVPAKVSLNKGVEVNIDELRPAQGITDHQVIEPYFLPENKTQQTVTVKNYHSLSDFFHFHSLTLSANNFESFDNYKPGIFWLANDLLNTSQVKLGYEYDMDTRKSNISAEVSYNKWFPKINLKYQNRGQVAHARVANTADQFTKFEYKEHVYSLDMQIPITTYQGKQIYSYGLNFGTSYQKRYDLSLNTLRNFQYEIAFPLNYQAYFNRNIRRSAMDLVPRWGQNISLLYRHLPFTEGITGTMFVIKSNFYFPGFFKNHAFQARFSYQHGTGRYEPVYEIPMVGGFDYFESEKLDNTLLLNYRFPIAYPDWSIGPLAYIKRFHGYFFADYQNVQKTDLAPVSFGLGLSADFNLLRYKLPDFGVGAKLNYINHPSARGKIVPNFSFTYSY